MRSLKNFIKKLLGLPPSHNIPGVEAHASSVISQDCVIGAFTYIGHHCFITRCSIGRYCSIANNVSVGIGEHKLDRVSTSSLFYEDPYQTLTEKESQIGNDVWIGSNSVIRRGITIGDGAVVGANSFVNKDVPDFAIVAGSPAKIIRYRLTDSQIKAVKDSGWWRLELEDARKEIERLKPFFPV